MPMIFRLIVDVQIIFIKRHTKLNSKTIGTYFPTKLTPTVCELYLIAL